MTQVKKKCTSLFADDKELAMLDDLKTQRGFKSDSSILRQGLFLLYAREFGNSLPTTKNYVTKGKITN